jgi:hypothetical protein
MYRAGKVIHKARLLAKAPFATRITLFITSKRWEGEGASVTALYKKEWRAA